MVVVGRGTVDAVDFLVTGFNAVEQIDKGFDHRWIRGCQFFGEFVALSFNLFEFVVP